MSIRKLRSRKAALILATSALMLSVSALTPKGFEAALQKIQIVQLIVPASAEAHYGSAKVAEKNFFNLEKWRCGQDAGWVYTCLDPMQWTADCNILMGQHSRRCYWHYHEAKVFVFFWKERTCYVKAFSKHGFISGVYDTCRH